MGDPRTLALPAGARGKYLIPTGLIRFASQSSVVAFSLFVRPCAHVSLELCRWWRWWRQLRVCSYRARSVSGCTYVWEEIGSIKLIKGRCVTRTSRHASLFAQSLRCLGRSGSDPSHTCSSPTSPTASRSPATSLPWSNYAFRLEHAPHEPDAVRPRFAILLVCNLLQHFVVFDPATAAAPLTLSSEQAEEQEERRLDVTADSEKTLDILNVTDTIARKWLRFLEAQPLRR